MIRILKLREEHLPGLIEVWKEFMDFHSDINPHFRRGKTGDVAFRKYLRDIMTSPETVVFVAVDGKKMVGYALLQIRTPPPVYDTATFGLLSDMAVAGEYRRQGIGEKLLKRSLAWFRSKGVTWIELSVITGNEVGGSFWAKHGFKELMRRLYLEMK